MKSLDVNFKVRVLAIAQLGLGGVEKVQEQVTPLVAELAERLKSDQLPRQLVALPTLLNLHPSSWSQHEE